MKTILILLLLGAATVRATIIPVDLGPPRIISYVRPTLADGHTAFLSVESNALAGTPVMGQTLILDYVFSDLLWVTETRNRGASFFAGALAHLDQSSADGVQTIPCYTSWMVRADGSAGPTLDFNPGGIQVIGPGRPSLSLGITYPDSDMLGMARAYSGMHFEVQLPDLAGVEITGIEIGFDGGYSSNWAIVNSTPDTGNTIWLTLGTLAGLAVLRRKI